MAKQRLTFAFEITIDAALLQIVGLQTKPDGTFVLPGGRVGQPYSLQLAATGGTPPYTWQASGLPPGLTITAGGLISGTPQMPGAYASEAGGSVEDSGT